MGVTLKDEKLLDSWGVVIEQGCGRGEGLMDTINQHLAHAELPGIAWKTVEAKPSLIKGLLGKKRDYLMMTNESLKDYRMYAGVRDYGVHLDISWFLTAEPGFFKQALSEMMTHGMVPNLL